MESCAAAGEGLLRRLRWVAGTGRPGEVRRVGSSWEKRASWKLSSSISLSVGMSCCRPQELSRPHPHGRQPRASGSGRTAAVCRLRSKPERLRQRPAVRRRAGGQGAAPGCCTDPARAAGVVGHWFLCEFPVGFCFAASPRSKTFSQNKRCGDRRSAPGCASSLVLIKTGIVP